MLTISSFSFIINILSHRLKDRTTSLKILLISAHKDRQCSRLRSRISAGHRCIQAVKSCFLRLLMNLNCQFRTARRHVNDVSSLLCICNHTILAKIRLLDILRVADNRNHDIAVSDALFHRISPLSALCDNIICLRLRAIVYSNLKSGLHQVADHSLSHNSGSDKSNFFQHNVFSSPIANSDYFCFCFLQTNPFSLNLLSLLPPRYPTAFSVKKIPHPCTETFYHILGQIAMFARNRSSIWLCLLHKCVILWNSKNVITQSGCAVILMKRCQQS